MADFAEMRTMDVWYSRLSEQDILAAAQAAQSSKKRGQGTAPWRQGGEGRATSARRPRRRPARVTAFRRCRSSGNWSMASIESPASRRSSCRLRDVAATYGMSPDELEKVRDQFRAYRSTLQEDRRHLLERFEVVDVARKVVGVGSVGTRALIVLLQGRDQGRSAVPSGEGGYGVGA